MLSTLEDPSASYAKMKLNGNYHLDCHRLDPSKDQNDRRITPVTTDMKFLNADDGREVRRW